MSTFYLIRHAQSDYNMNHSHLIGGRSSHSPLSAEGILQAEKLGMRLKRENIKIDNWIASSALRAQQTAKIAMSIAAPQAQLVIDETIEELCQGDWEGRPRGECYTPETMEAIKRDNWNFKAPNGESQKEVEERMLRFIHEWQQNKGEAVNAVFTHGIAIKCSLRGIYDWLPEMTYRTAIENTSLTVMRHQQGLWHVDRINDHAHLLG